MKYLSYLINEKVLTFIGVLIILIYLLTNIYSPTNPSGELRTVDGKFNEYYDALQKENLTFEELTRNLIEIEKNDSLIHQYRQILIIQKKIENRFKEINNHPFENNRFSLEVIPSFNTYYTENESVSKFENNRDFFTKEYFKSETKFLSILSQKEDLVDSVSAVGFDQIDKLIRNLGYSNISFNAPDELFLDEDHPVIALVSNKLTEIELFDKVEESLGKSIKDSIEHYNIRSSMMLEAQLTGQSFSVTSGNPVRQPISNSDVTKWEWVIKPIEKGEKILVLTINAILIIDGKESPYTVETFRKNIKVNIRNPFLHNIKVFKDYLIPILTLIIGSVGTLIGKAYVKRRKKRGKKEKKN